MTKAMRKNLASYFSRSEYVISTPQGWELLPEGLQLLFDRGLLLKSRPALAGVAVTLRKELARLKNDETKRFVTEAVECLESEIYRAAVVLSWVGAMSVMYHFVVANCLDDFNAEAARRFKNWKTANTRDDLAQNMGENNSLKLHRLYQ